MVKDWYSYGVPKTARPEYSEPPDHSEPKEERHVKLGILLLVWTVSILISVGIPFLLFIFDADGTDNIDKLYIIKNSSLLRDIGLILFVQVTAFFISLYRQKGRKLSIRDSQFVLNIVALLLACIDTFLCQKYSVIEKDTLFKSVLWIALVVCSGIIGIFGQLEIPHKGK